MDPVKTLSIGPIKTTKEIGALLPKINEILIVSLSIFQISQKKTEPKIIFASYTPFLMQGEKQVDRNLLYNLLCVLKPLVDYGLYGPWNEEGQPNVREEREELNKKMTECFVEFSKYKGIQIYHMKIYNIIFNK